MKQYVVTGRVIEIHGGKLALTKEQAARRAHNLERISKKGSNYNVINPVQFKQGEEFGFDGDLPKRLSHLVRPLADADAKAKADADAKAKADADAKAK